MLNRLQANNGVVYLTSARLGAQGVPHAFSTRIGGVSPAPFASLNLGRHSSDAAQDSTDNLQANFRLFQAAIGADRLPLAWVKQVHGAGIAILRSEPGGEYSETLSAELNDRYRGQTEADAVISDQPGVLVCVRIADCVPILLAGPHGHVVGAVHAGWRGIVAGVAGQAVAAMTGFGIHPTAITAAIGPAIGAEAFEVGPQVAAEFEQADLAEAVVKPEVGGKPHIDLRAAVQKQLTAAGVVQIDDSNDPAFCTYRNQEAFFSHRRDGPVTGRMAAVIAAISRES
ncbi:MAG: peptidoglycan editing factor PgeF [Phycisphaerae bacterium]